MHTPVNFQDYMYSEVRQDHGLESGSVGWLATLSCSDQGDYYECENDNLQLGIARDNGNVRAQWTSGGTTYSCYAAAAPGDAGIGYSKCQIVN